MKHLIRFLWLFFLSLTLSSCGFHLRGQSGGIVTPQGNSATIFVAEAASEQSLSKLLSLSLQFARYKLTQKQQDADYQIVIIETGQTQKAIGVDQYGRNNEFEISLLIRYLIIVNHDTDEDLAESHANDDSLQDSTFSHQLQRSVYIDADDIIGKRSELTMLRQNLNEEMVAYMLRQLSQTIAEQATRKRQG